VGAERDRSVRPGETGGERNHTRAAADSLTLSRRISFALTGLPPSEEALTVDRLLSSPRYGEHWGRHWMDVARYADSTGADEDHRIRTRGAIAIT
jgi:hypothetical protein